MDMLVVEADWVRILLAFPLGLVCGIVAAIIFNAVFGDWMPVAVAGGGFFICIVLGVLTAPFSALFTESLALVGGIAFASGIVLTFLGAALIMLYTLLSSRR